MEQITQTICFVLLISSIYPLGLAWAANRSRSLSNALVWTVLAWFGWLVYAGAMLCYRPHFEERTLCYVVLCVTCGAGVAVLGARRPGVGAWNFVVLGLLAVMLWPLLEQLVAGEIALGWLRLSFVGLTLALICLNYLPTCMYVASLLFALTCTLEFLTLLGWQWQGVSGWEFLGPAVWAGYLGWRWRKRSIDEFNQLWFDFRNRIGFIWAQRMREYFNRSAENAGWPVYLSWQGLRTISSPTVENSEFQEKQAVELFTAMLKRFGPEEKYNGVRPNQPDLQRKEHITNDISGKDGSAPYPK